jgi:type IV pilus assembly protein PilE
MTLIELMIVVVIATILIGIAIPSYSSYVLRSHRVEAKTALMDLAGREERYLSTSQTGANYSQTPGDLGYPNPPGFPATVGSGYYQVRVCAIGPGMNAGCTYTTQTAPAYEIDAVPLGNQNNDTQCAVFAIDNTGKQWAYSSTNVDNTQLCWNN